MARRFTPMLDGSWSFRHHDNDISNSADQAEWSALLCGAAHVSAGTMDDEMSEAADEDAFPDGRSDGLLQHREVAREAIQGAVAEMVIERAGLLGPAYPFEVEGSTLTYRPGSRPIYELMLGITQAPSLTAGGFAVLPRLFENLSKIAGMAYLGPAARGYRTGWPRPGDAARFKSLIGELRKECGAPLPEWQWAPDADRPDNPVPALVKDEGLDVVVWRNWGEADMRIGQLYLFGQCACGRNWMDKAQDINLAVLEQWFKRPRVQPVRAFFTPFYVVGNLLGEHSLRAGLVFDRVRMVHVLQEDHIQSELDLLAEDVEAAIALVKSGSVGPAAL